MLEAYGKANIIAIDEIKMVMILQTTSNQSLFPPFAVLFPLYISA